MRLLDTPTPEVRGRRALVGALAVLALTLALAPAVGFASEDGGGAGSAFAIIFAVLAVAIALGLPLFVIIGILGVVCYWTLAEDFQGIETLVVLPEETARLMKKQELLAIPFFVASGAIMSAGGIAKRLVAFARAFVGVLPGGLGIATVGACVFFAAISGSSPVTVIAIGSMMYPALVKAGYDRRFTLGLLTSAGSLGILIPPSIPMLVFAIVAGGRQPLDVSELFLAGVIPGLFIGALLALYSAFRGLKMKRDTFSFAEVRRTFVEGIWALSLPLVILGGIYSGTFGPTAAAAISVVYALAIEIFVHRDISVKDLPKILAEAASQMGTVLVIMTLAMALNMFLVEEQVPNAAVAWIRTMNLTPFTFLLIVNIFLIFVGMFMDSISAILIIAPLLAPISQQLGIDPVHLGVIFIVNLEIGYLTPPIGINLFVASSVFRRPLGEVIQGAIPFIGVMLVGLLVVTYVPTLSMGPVNVWYRNKPFYEPFPTMPEAVEDATEAGLAEGGAKPGEEAGVIKPPEGGVNPETGKKVLSMEEMMKASAAAESGGELDYLEEDEEDEDE